MGKHESDKHVEHKREAWYPGKEDSFEDARKDTYDKSAVQTQENYGKKTEASKRTVEVVGIAIENSDLPAADKKVANTVARAIAEGDTGRLQDCIDKLSQTKEGRETLKETIKELNDIYADNGLKDLHLAYPVDKDRSATNWELEVRGESKGSSYNVYFKPGERPVSGTSYGPHHNLDLGDNADTDKSQEERSAKVLRKITEHAQEDL